MSNAHTARPLALALVAGSILAGCQVEGQAAATRRPPVSAAQPNQPASGNIADPAFLEQFAATYRFGAGTPRGITITPDGKSVLFLRSGPRSVVQDLYEINVATGYERVLLTADKILNGAQERLSAEELARRERMRMSSRGIVGYSMSKDGNKILVPLSGKLYVIERATLRVREVGTHKGFPIGAVFSDDASTVACTREGDLYVIDVDSGTERRLTTKPEGKAGETIDNGIAEFVAAEEMARFDGFWLSPDAKSVAYCQVDTAGLETFTIADPVNPDKGPQSWPYPRPGKKNATVKLGVLPTAGGPTTWVNWDHDRYPYVVTVRWDKNAPLTLVVSNRAQTEMVVYAVEPSTGSLTEILTERDAAWVEIRQSVPHWLEDGSGFLWISEAGGWPELQWRDRSGKLLATLAGKDVGFRGLIDVDNAKGAVYISASVDPTQSHVWAVPLNMSFPPQQLTQAEGTHGLIASKNFSAIVLTSSTAKGERSASVLGEKGDPTPIKSVAEKPPFMPNVEWTTVGSGDRIFQAYVIRPRNFEKGRKYPVIDSVYAGPTANVVTKTLWGSLLNQWIADHGFIVVGLDNRGTENRGRTWQRAWKLQSGNSKGDLIDIALADQADGVKMLVEKYPEMDGARVGVYGWSFGGYFSAMAAMRRPDVFKAGCAGAPVCDFADYDTTYTERYLGTPQENPEGYKNSSVLTWAKDLKVPLMVIHGTADDNVYFMHSLKMTDALFRAGKKYDFLVLPGFTHMVPDPVVTRSLYTRVADFFVRELQPGPSAR